VDCELQRLAMGSSLFACMPLMGDRSEPHNILTSGRVVVFLCFLADDLRASATMLGIPPQCVLGEVPASAVFASSPAGNFSATRSFELTIKLPAPGIAVRPCIPVAKFSGAATESGLRCTAGDTSFTYPRLTHFK